MKSTSVLSLYLRLKRALRVDEGTEGTDGAQMGKGQVRALFAGSLEVEG